jgi:head-tail adaptor
MAINPGRFREYVRIERPVKTASSFGGAAITSWELVEDAFAEVIHPTSPDRSHEAAAAGRSVTERLLQFRLRLPSPIASTHRIVWPHDSTDYYGVEGLLADHAKGEIVATGVYRGGTDGR